MDSCHLSYVARMTSGGRIYCKCTILNLFHTPNYVSKLRVGECVVYCRNHLCRHQNCPFVGDVRKKTEEIKIKLK